MLEAHRKRGPELGPAPGTAGQPRNKKARASAGVDPDSSDDAATGAAGGVNGAVTEEDVQLEVRPKQDEIARGQVRVALTLSFPLACPDVPQRSDMEADARVQARARPSEGEPRGVRGPESRRRSQARRRRRVLDSGEAALPSERNGS